LDSTGINQKSKVMAWPKSLIGLPLSIDGQYIRVRDPQRALSHSYMVFAGYGKPVSAQWNGDWVQFTTDKGKTFMTDCSTLRSF
jgi:hypothetical protein